MINMLLQDQNDEEFEDEEEKDIDVDYDEIIIANTCDLIISIA